MQSGLVQSHHPASTHPQMMLMATQGPPGGPQQAMPQTALNHIPVSTTTHFSYLAHPQGTFILLTSTLLLGGGGLKMYYIYCLTMISTSLYLIS